MASNFWKDNQGPMFMLAPMEDVTDTTFRQLVMEISNPEHLHVLFCEFMNTDGFCHPEGRERVAQRLRINDSEQELLNKTNTALVAQIWGTNPENFYQTAKYISEHTSFNGIDINMGCPMKNIIKKGACSALIDQPALAKEIIEATIEGSSLPVSVKTRIGVKEVVTEKWISHLLTTDIQGLTVHGRVQKMLSTGQADWNEIAKAKQLAKELNKDIKIIGNGDVLSLEQGYDYIDKYDLDGIMIGRGIFHNPWFFNTSAAPEEAKTRLDALMRHAQLFSETWQTEKPWNILKRFFKIYISGLRGAGALREGLMLTKNMDDLNEVIENYFAVNVGE
ncbi:tRNA dihydrouridine synthase [Plebeiibacterium sediminum]|uniref:tRNA-dihydrouridine synthase n=1 Tax=Plebeiibacterium sediminum TaxID=2992112 RepID=A0AAE3SI93_9BACT|nr:tRNA-dihydrouridine synthase [Plebeiobacterium sediminum]MCW3788958.1 tRNA-dihydrouridine synthase [Plebeiobacterium sediminum]